METILRRRAQMNADFVLVIASRDDAAGLATASALGVPTCVVASKAYASRELYDAALNETLLAHGVDFVVLAGFMRILTDAFVAQWTGRLVNIHPSLLPSFAGLHAQRQALEAGVRVAGCTVHFVEPGAVDGGAIIAQGVVPVYSDDDEGSLQERIQVVEHRLYPESLIALFDGRLRWVDGRVVARSREDAIAIV